VSKFVRNLTLFLAGLPLSTKAAPGPNPDAPRPDDLSKTVSLRPLNLALDNLFASHRSHSSHASHSSHSSHSSHYSGSGSSTYTSPSLPSPAAPAPVAATAATTTDASPATPRTPLQAAVATEPALSLAEKRQLQIMRVQIKLLTLGLYNGLPESGLMTTPTLNALGVPAVN
jgi:His-Xaa-Ser repeat protein HxsA